jgi:hypothetical protein
MFDQKHGVELPERGKLFFGGKSQVQKLDTLAGLAVKYNVSVRPWLTSPESLLRLI